MNNKIGAYFTTWAATFEADYDDCIRKAAELGFDSIGIRGTGIIEFSKEKQLATRKLADDLGINLTFGAALARPDIDISSEDPEARKNGMAYMRRIIEAVAFMKGNTMTGPFYSQWHGTLPVSAKDKRPWIDRSVANMKELCKIAGDNGIRLSLEIVNRYETFLLNTAAEGVAYCKEVGAPNLGLHLDTFHMNIEEVTIPDGIATGGKYITHFHVGEANRDVPGPRGHINWKEVFTSLKNVGYKDIIEFEPFMTMGTSIANIIGVWRDLTDGQSVDEKMRQSLKFVKEQMAAV